MPIFSFDNWAAGWETVRSRPPIFLTVSALALRDNYSLRATFLGVKSYWTQLLRLLVRHTSRCHIWREHIVIAGRGDLALKGLRFRCARSGSRTTNSGYGKGRNRLTTDSADETAGSLRGSGMVRLGHATREQIGLDQRTTCCLRFGT